MSKAYATAWSREITASRVMWAVAAAMLLLHLLSATNYGYFRDELYFLACSRHLAAGYVDMAPLIAWVTALVRVTLGQSLFAIHLLPSIAAAALVILAGKLTQQLGGSAKAVALSCLAILCSIIYLALYSLNSMNAFEPLLWTGCLYCVVLAIQRDQPRWWLLFGALAGLSLENKHSTLFFGAAVFLALLLTRERRFLASRWIWLGAALAALLFLPNVIWQIQHNFPTLEDLRNVSRMHKNVVLPPGQFLAQQVLIMNPANAVIWLAGLWWFFFSPTGKRYRIMGWTYVIFLGEMMALHGKNYYVAPIYPILFAGGAVAIEAWTSFRRRWMVPALGTLMVIIAALVGPTVMPILPPATLVSYMQRTHITPPKAEVAHNGLLPQVLGDRFGWPEIVDIVARGYFSLPPEERANTIIVASNYGEAGAIDLLGVQPGLPHAWSAHQNYFYWGPPPTQPANVIVLQDNRETLERECGSVEDLGTPSNPYEMAEEHTPIYLCRGLKLNLQEHWPTIKHWN